MIGNDLRRSMAGLLDQEPDRGVDIGSALEAGRSALRARRMKVVLSSALAAIGVAAAVPLATTALIKSAVVAPAVAPSPTSVVDAGAALPKWCTATSREDCVDIDGWIVYQALNGIWAVDPNNPNDRDHRVQLTDEGDAYPLEWSADGSMLLVRHQGENPRLSVLHADGAETDIAAGPSYFDGSFSPDGSKVVFTGSGGMSIADSDGSMRRSLVSGAYKVAFSPDGKQVAHFTGGGDNSHTLRIMNLDGTGDRTVSFHDCCHVDDLDWSPGGERLLFSFRDGGGIWTVGADGSKLTKVVSDGVNPAWSPDGARIAYDGPDGLRIADADGSHVTEFGFGGSGAWNPLPLDR